MGYINCNVSSISLNSNFTVTYSLDAWRDDDYAQEAYLDLYAYDSSGHPMLKPSEFNPDYYVDDYVRIKTIFDSTAHRALSDSFTTSISSAEFLAANSELYNKTGIASYKIHIWVSNFYGTDWQELFVPLNQPFTAPSAPTSVSVDTSSVVPGGTTTLRWSGASPGQNVSIAGYHVYYATSPSGSYSYLGAVSTSATSGSMAVTAPTANGSSYYYKVYTIGSVSGYNSGISSAYAGLTASVSNCGAPTSVLLSSTTSTGGNITLSWSGASGGTNNSITGYDVYRREYSASSGTWSSYASYQSVASTNTSGTLSVPAPSTLSNIYQYEVRTKGSAGSSYYSGFAASSNTIQRIATLTAPSNLSISASTSNTAAISWSASTMTGASGTITYSIRKNGTQVATTTGTSYTFEESTTKNWGTSAVTLTVVATYSGYSSAASSGVSYTYSTSISPATNLSVSPTSGQSTTLTWTAGSRGDGGDVKYNVLINGSVVASDLTTCSYTISAATASAQSTNPMSIVVRTTGAGKSADSSSVTFTYVAPHKYVKIYNGSSWVRYVAHYYNGSSWVESTPKRYNGSSWDTLDNP